MKHKHAELIHAWADGANIEQYIEGTDTWVFTPIPNWASHCPLRVAPILPKYRVALCSCPSGNYLTESVDTDFQESEMGTRRDFVGRLTDWVEYKLIFDRA